LFLGESSASYRPVRDSQDGDVTKGEHNQYGLVKRKLTKKETLGRWKMEKVGISDIYILV